jgi:hypothetical protein
VDRASRRDFRFMRPTPPFQRPRRRHRTSASMMMTVAAMAILPSASMLTPQKSMSNLSDMRGSPFEKRESLRGTINLRAALIARQDGPFAQRSRKMSAATLKTLGPVRHSSAKIFWAVHSF